MNHSSVTMAGAFAILIGASAACYSTVDAEPVDYAETTSAPVDIDTYPSYVYMGEPVYFYGGHWWHRDGAHWAYYRDEPAELHRQRPAAARALRARGQVRGAARAEVHEERR
jgi:hypothetical protein